MEKQRKIIIVSLAASLMAVILYVFGITLAKGNIIILGALRGAAHAGICGNEDAVIVAFEMAPISVRIAGLSLKKAEKGRHLGRGPMMILSENGKVVEEPIKKSFLSALNFI